MSVNTETKWSSVEDAFLEKSGRKKSYDGEKIPIVEVQNIYELGKLVALRFLEWVMHNPTGVIALPTGRTPEFFIKTLEHLRNNWNDDSIQKDIKKHGLHIQAPSSSSTSSTTSFPDTSGLHFVMLDEFFPMLPTHRNSFCNYIELFYISTLRIKKENILKFDLIGANALTHDEMSEFSSRHVDLSLLHRDAIDSDEVRRKAVLHKVDNYCKEVEYKIRKLGGIGFFLGGIGPDGHIAFNQEGSPHDSITRLVNFNYPTAAAAAGDLGGIEVAKGKAAMTIGLGTIAHGSLVNPNATVIIMAAGEGKATVVRAAIEDEVDISRPASILHSLHGGRFYITHGAANALTARKAETIQNITSEEALKWALKHLSGIAVEEGIPSAHMVVPSADYTLAETLIYNTSLKCLKPVHSLHASDLKCLPESASVPSWLLDELSFQVMIACAARRLREKVEGGLKFASTKRTTILHTAPHHDDIMLSYHAAMHEMLGRQEVSSAATATATVGKKDSSSNISSSGNSSNKVVTRLLRTRSGSFSSSLAASTPNNNNTGNSNSTNANAAYPSKLGEQYNENLNYFAYLTSGFHSVNDSFLLKQANAVAGPESSYKFLHDAVCSGELGRDYDDLMGSFNEAFFDKDERTQDIVENIIFLRKIAEVWMISITQSYSVLEQQLKDKIHWLIHTYLAHHNPGDAVPLDMQLLKGCMRESEVDRVWALSRMPMNRIHHMRSKFYNDDFFTPMPSLVDDALPFSNLLRLRQPEIVTVAFDPEGTGPDTHYKVLQVVAAGLRISLDSQELMNPNPIVVGYRNVWFVFTPSDATLLIPGSESDLDLMHDTFMSCFTTQKAASFPSPHYDGPFSAWARHLQQEQKKCLEILLGSDYFINHKDARVRDCNGFVYLKAMHVHHFLKEVEELKSRFENV